MKTFILLATVGLSSALAALSPASVDKSTPPHRVSMLPLSSATYVVKPKATSTYTASLENAVAFTRTTTTCSNLSCRPHGPPSLIKAASSSPTKTASSSHSKTASSSHTKTTSSFPTKTTRPKTKSSYSHSQTKAHPSSSIKVKPESGEFISAGFKWSSIPGGTVTVTVSGGAAATHLAPIVAPIPIITSSPAALVEREASDDDDSDGYINSINALVPVDCNIATSSDGSFSCKYTNGSQIALAWRIVSGDEAKEAVKDLGLCSAASKHVTSLAAVGLLLVSAFLI